MPQVRTPVCIQLPCLPVDQQSLIFMDFRKCKGSFASTENELGKYIAWEQGPDDQQSFSKDLRICNDSHVPFKAPRLTHQAAGRTVNHSGPRVHCWRKYCELSLMPLCKFQGLGRAAMLIQCAQVISRFLEGHYQTARLKQSQTCMFLKIRNAEERNESLIFQTQDEFQ